MKSQSVLYWVIKLLRNNGQQVLQLYIYIEKFFTVCFTVQK